jgi:hypothetical protein
MTDSTGPVKPRLSDESVNLDQPRWQLSQALVRGEVQPHAFLTGHNNGESRRARTTSRTESSLVTGLAVSVAAVGLFLVGAYLLFRRDQTAPGALSGLAAIAIGLQAAWYRLRR